MIFKTTSPTSLSVILQSWIDVADEDEFDGGENFGNETNLSNPSALKRSSGAGNLTSKGAKRGNGNTNYCSGNTKKSGKAARRSNYLTPDAKKAFNHLWHTFIPLSIFQYFDLKQHI